MKSINIKGKNYFPVNERVKAFRAEKQGFALITEIITLDDNQCTMIAKVIDPNGFVLATGHAHEEKDDKTSMVNKTSYVENCETSAIGRALGSLGYGIDEEFASADELVLALAQQDRIKAQSSNEQPKQAQSTADIEITLADALRLTTSKGKPFSECTDDQLQYIVDNSKDVRKVAGAKAILKDRQECQDLLPIEEEPKYNPQKVAEYEEGLPF